MSYSTNIPQALGKPLETEIVSTVPAARQPGFLSILFGRANSTLEVDIQDEAQIAAFRAWLAESSLTRLGALSVMEQQLSSMTPQAAERYHALVDAYAKQAIEQIGRW